MFSGFGFGPGPADVPDMNKLNETGARYMQFAVNVSDIIGPLLELVSIAGENLADNKDDICNNILMSVKGRQLFLKTTNYSMTMSTSVPVLVVDKEGSTTINAFKLRDVLNTLKGESRLYFNLDKEHENLSLSSDTTKFEMRTRNAECFPGIEPEGPSEKITISQSLFKTLLDKARFCICGSGDYRDYLKGLRLEAEQDQLAIFTSDGMRLTMLEAGIDNHVSAFIGVILTKKCVDKLYSILDGNSDGKFDITLTKDTFSTVCNGYTLVSKLIIADYPAVRGILPKNIGSTACVPRDNLMRQMKKVSSIIVNGVRTVIFSFNNNMLQLCCKNTEQELATTDLPVSFSAKPLEVAYDADKLREILEKIDSKNVIFSFSEPLTNTMLTLPEDVQSPSFRARYVMSRIVL